MNRSSFPLPSAGAYPPRVAVAPLAKPLGSHWQSHSERFRGVARKSIGVGNHRLENGIRCVCGLHKTSGCHSLGTLLSSWSIHYPFMHSRLSLFDPFPRFPVSYCPRPATSPGRAAGASVAHSVKLASSERFGYARNVVTWWVADGSKTNFPNYPSSIRPSDAHSIVDSCKWFDA